MTDTGAEGASKGAGVSADGGISFDRVFGLFLAKSRILRKISQVELASRSGLPQSTISAYERGAKIVRSSHLELLIRALGISLGQCLEGLYHDYQSMVTNPPVPLRSLGENVRGAVRQSAAAAVRVASAVLRKDEDDEEDDGDESQLEPQELPAQPSDCPPSPRKRKRPA